MKQFSAILLTLLMFFTNMNITLATHFCGDKAVETSFVFNSEEIGCGMEEMEKECNSTSSQSTVKSKGCCKNEYTQISTENSLNVPVSQISQGQNNFIIALVHIFSTSTLFSTSFKSNYNLYSPPLVPQDIPILVQSFRI